MNRKQRGSVPSGHSSDATGSPPDVRPPDAEAIGREGEMRDLVNNPMGPAPHFADVPGSKTVLFREAVEGPDPGLGQRGGPDLYRERGFDVVESDSGNEPQEEERPQEWSQAESVPGARIPGDIAPGDEPPDIASESRMLPEVTPDDPSVESASDPSHIMRGGPGMSSQRPQS